MPGDGQRPRDDMPDPGGPYPDPAGGNAGAGGDMGHDNMPDFPGPDGRYPDEDYPPVPNRGEP